MVARPEGAEWEKKWLDVSEQYPLCAKCDVRIGSPEEDEDREMQDEAAYYLPGPVELPPALPIRVWRDHPDPERASRGEKQEMAFHVECAKAAGIL